MNKNRSLDSIHSVIFIINTNRGTRWIAIMSLRYFYLYFIDEREEEAEITGETEEARWWWQGDHHVDFVFQFWMFDHGDEEGGRAERMAHVNQFRLTVFRQDVVDIGWNVVLAHFVPSVQVKIVHSRLKNHRRCGELSPTDSMGERIIQPASI